MKKRDFFIGAATAGHQVEGNNIYSDIWAMEHMKYSSFVEKSLEAVDHYNRFKEDIRLLAEAGLNAYRFSIEWARIEPEEGQFCQAEIEHYRQVFETCLEHGIIPIVTMHHFSSPKWLISLGGWESEAVIMYFARYCKYVVENLGNYMEYICTINEANMGMQIAGFVKKLMSGDKKNSLQIGMSLKKEEGQLSATEAENLAVFGVKNPAVFLGARTEEGDNIIIKAHLAAKEAIKSINTKIKVGLTLSLHDIQISDGGEGEVREEWNNEFMHYVPFLKEDDFIGVQNYTRTVIDKNGSVEPGKSDRKTQMGYEFYPQALENVIRKVYQELKLPIVVTENGVATSDDNWRCEFIDIAMQGIQKCLDEKIPVHGYLHWSLLDNFEWQKGYEMTFGLIRVDRNTQTRYPKRSLFHLGEYNKHE